MRNVVLQGCGQKDDSSALRLQIVVQVMRQLHNKQRGLVRMLMLRGSVVVENRHASMMFSSPRGAFLPPVSRMQQCFNDQAGAEIESAAVPSTQES